MVSWLPIIWNDYDWDHVYFYIIIRHKLREMEKFFRSDAVWSMKAEKCADDMKKCILTLDRLINDDYNSLAGGDILDKKWGNLEMEFTEAGLGENKKKYRQLLLTRKNVITFEDSEISDREFDIVKKREDVLRKQDLKYLFEQLNKHIVTWWD
jgi:hypothetical protein